MQTPGFETARAVMLLVQGLESERFTPELVALQQEAARARTDENAAFVLCEMILRLRHAGTLPEVVQPSTVDQARVATEAYVAWRSILAEDLSREGSRQERLAYVHLSNIGAAVEFFPRLAAVILSGERTEYATVSLRRMEYSLLESFSVLEDIRVDSHDRFFHELLEAGKAILTISNAERVCSERIPEVSQQCRVWSAQNTAGKRFGYRVPK